MIAKHAPTDRNAGQGLALRHVLRTTRTRTLGGARVLVYDDVFTTGHTLNEVARSLRHPGASRIDGIFLARQIWQ